jgi:Domain of unknown function (DUF932)
MTAMLAKQKNAGLKFCSLNDLLFKAEMVKQTDFDCNSDYAYDIFGYLGKEQIKTRLNSCSERYELVLNQDIFPPVRQMLLEKGISFDEKYMHLNNARFYANYVINDMPYKIAGTNDEIKPMLNVQHSYNGLTKYMITFGYYRIVCTNGLTIPVKEKDNFNLAVIGKHTSSIKETVNKLFNVVELFVQGSNYLVNFNYMADRAVINLDDRIKEVMSFAKINVTENKNFDTLDYIGGIVKKEAENLYNGRVNDFLVYNGINQYINDNNLNIKSPEVRAEADKKVLQYMLG